MRETTQNFENVVPYAARHVTCEELSISGNPTTKLAKTYSKGGMEGGSDDTVHRNDDAAGKKPQRRWRAVGQSDGEELRT